MEINNKVIRFPFQRHVSYSNYMKKNKRLINSKIKKISEPGYKDKIYYLHNKN